MCPSLRLERMLTGITKIPGAKAISIINNGILQINVLKVTGAGSHIVMAHIERHLKDHGLRSHDVQDNTISISCLIGCETKNVPHGYEAPNPTSKSFVKCGPPVKTIKAPIKFEFKKIEKIASNV